MTIEYTVEMKDPASGNYVLVTAELYDYGQYENYNDESGYWSEIIRDPVFRNYTYEDTETGAFGVMPDYWKEEVDLILCNIYWDRELNR